MPIERCETDHAVRTGRVEANRPFDRLRADGCRLAIVAALSCALGSAISAAVLAGAHRDFPAAQRAMTSLRKTSYRPKPGRRKTYDLLYEQYRILHDGFGGVRKDVDLSRVMKELLELKARVRDA